MRNVAGTTSKEDLSLEPVILHKLILFLSESKETEVAFAKKKHVSLNDSAKGGF